MLTGTITITAKTGPDKAATSTAITNVKSFTLDYEREVLTIKTGNDYREFDMNGITGFADTVSGTTFNFEVD
jgi:hypothetical protein